MKTIKNSQGLYFVTTKGFVARSQSEATKFKAEEVNDTVKCLYAATGVTGLIVEDVKVESDPNIVQNRDGSSFAVHYVRKNQVRSDGSVIAHKNNPSRRRFATEDEAQHHARRFAKIEGHVGFWIQKRTEPVNAYVNKVTGKTNPVVGKGRTNR